MTSPQPTPEAIRATVQQLLAHQNIQISNVQKSKHKSNKRELEFAVTVLLVDLATSDQHFDPEEYNVIVHGLMRLFGTSRQEVSGLINQAETVLRNLRGISHFGKILKDNLSPDEKLIVMDIIEEVIYADGIENEYEVYLRHKIRGLLGFQSHEKIQR